MENGERMEKGKGSQNKGNRRIKRWSIYYRRFPFEKVRPVLARTALMGESERSVIMRSILHT